MAERLTNSQKRERRRQAEAEAEREFAALVTELNTPEEALALANRPLSRRSPGLHLYQHLAAFLRDGRAPATASVNEVARFVELRQRFRLLAARKKD